MSTMYSVGQMNQLGDALESVGYTPDHVTKMRSSHIFLAQLKEVLEGRAEILPIKHVIDLDAGGGSRVRYLSWNGDQWVWYGRWLGYDWSGACPAAVSAS